MLGLALALLGCRSREPASTEGEAHLGEAESAGGDEGEPPKQAALREPFAGIEALRPRPWAAWPLENVDIEGYDGWRIDAVHGGFERDRGLVFASDPQAFVLAIADGKVVELRPVEDEDGTAKTFELRLDHGSGIESSYAPLSDALVHAGLPVGRGAAIGLAAGSSLRLRVTIDGIEVDPLLILRQPLHRWPALLRTLPKPPPEPTPGPG
jgi:murein DD-endopeptidase MepM/ murein hydrolase activator NlpD